MGDLSKNFNRSEFACKGTNCCGHSAAVHPDLVDALQTLRDRIGKPLSITSGFRCNRHNKAVGGAEQSFHTLGMVEPSAGIEKRCSHVPDSNGYLGSSCLNLKGVFIPRLE